MKNFKQLIKELPSNRVVAAFGQFQPPTAGHEQLVKAVQTLATSTDHVIYASTNEDKKHPLPVDRKVYFLKRMFAEANFQPAGFETIVEAAYELSKKYKHLTVVTFADKVAEYESQLKENNGKLYAFESIKVVSAGDVDPDSNTVSAISGVAMCESAKKGNFVQFKKGVPHTLTELDSRRLMNDVRKGMGLEPIRETINLVKDEIREQYFRGEIFNVGDIVESAGQQYEIVKRGSNHLLVKAEDGSLVSKFITDVTEAVKDVTTAKVEKKSKELAKKSGSAEKEVDIAKPSVGKPMSVLPKKKEDPKKNQSDFSKNDPRNYKKFKEHIEKVKGGYEVESEHGNKNLGKSTTLAGAKKRLKQVEYFKHMHEEHDDQYELATGFKAAAEHSLSKGNMGAYHAHMANHHDHMGQWHEKKGRNNSADREYEKANHHHGESLKHPYISEDVMVESFSSIEHHDDHKKITHGADFNLMIGKEHHGKISNLQHGDRHVFKCKAGNEYGCWRNGDNLHFTRHSHDSGLYSNMSVHIPVAEWNNQDAMGQDKPVSESVHDNRTGFRKRHREDDEYHNGPDPVRHTYNYTVSKDGEEKHSRKVTTGMTTRPKHELEHMARAHLEKQGYKIHEETEQIDEISSKLAGNYYGAATKQHIAKVGVRHNMYDRIEKDMGKKRKQGVDRALDRVMGNRKTNEEVVDEARMSARVKLQRAFEREQQKSEASRKRAEELLNPKKPEPVKEDSYSSDIKVKKVQVQDKDGNWVFKDHKYHPHKVDFKNSKMNGKPAQVEDPTKIDTETAYQNHLDKNAKARNESWVLNPDGKTKKKYKDIKDKKTLEISSGAGTTFDPFSNTSTK